VISCLLCIGLFPVSCHSPIFCFLSLNPVFTYIYMSRLLLYIIVPNRGTKAVHLLERIFTFPCAAQKNFVRCTYIHETQKKSGKITYPENRRIQELIENKYIKTTKIILPMSFLIDANRVLYSVQCTSRLQVIRRKFSGV
jgi:hypothetical protein